MVALKWGVIIPFLDVNLVVSIWKYLEVKFKNMIKINPGIGWIIHSEWIFLNIKSSVEVNFSVVSLEVICRFFPKIFSHDAGF